ncbi:MAG: FAD-dependent oxidoreductase, partial [Bacteroidota bacterium]|nr:FAD-dependent oxidoreductase [Bacteroidota bacterium]
EQVKEYSIPMKSISEAIYLRNYILKNYETALNQTDPQQTGAYMTVAVVGGGPTGVELAGALAEMKRYILPKDYPELDFSLMNVYLFEASDRLLNGMSTKASVKAEQYLKDLGVKVFLRTAVKDYDGKTIVLSEDRKLLSRTLVWAAGVSGKIIPGIPTEAIARANRIQVDEFNRIKGLTDVFAVGDLCYLQTIDYPSGHPQVAQVAIQQAGLLAKNIQRMEKGESLKPFHYTDRGSMATVGRNLAVADLPGLKIQGFMAWVLWLFVHLMSLVGIKNRFMTFINWVWNYLTFDQSLRLLIKPKIKKEKTIPSSS